jgi:energy-coupling factor transporter ATP-binding protein EcfA2
MAKQDEPNKVIYSMVGVGKVHGPKQVLKDISLGYFYGAKIGVIGLNGSGKSSLLKIMAGLDAEFLGEVHKSASPTPGCCAWERRSSSPTWTRRAPASIPEKSAYEVISGGLDNVQLGKLLSQGGGIGEKTAAAGLKEALQVGAERTALQISKVDGFLGNALIRTALPEEVRPMADALRKLGMGKEVDHLEVALNRAAERAARGRPFSVPDRWPPLRPRRGQDGVVVGVGRSLEVRSRMLLEFLHQEFHRLFELRVVALAHEFGILPDRHVRRDAVVLHVPVAA